MSWHRTTGRHRGTTNLSGGPVGERKMALARQTLQGMADRVNGRDDSVDQNCE